MAWGIAFPLVLDAVNSWTTAVILALYSDFTWSALDIVNWWTGLVDNFELTWATEFTAECSEDCWCQGLAVWVILWECDFWAFVVLWSWLAWLTAMAIALAAWVTSLDVDFVLVLGTFLRRWCWWTLLFSLQNVTYLIVLRISLALVIVAKCVPFMVKLNLCIVMPAECAWGARAG